MTGYRRLGGRKYKFLYSSGKTRYFKIVALALGAVILLIFHVASVRQLIKKKNAISPGKYSGQL